MAKHTRPLLYPGTHVPLPDVGLRVREEIASEHVEHLRGRDVRMWHTTDGGASLWLVACRDVSLLRGLRADDYSKTLLWQTYVLWRADYAPGRCNPSRNVTCFGLDGAAAYLARTRARWAHEVVPWALYDVAGKRPPEWLRERRGPLARARALEYLRSAGLA
jgi:hypothetical protein